MTRPDDVDVLEALAAMKPDLAELESSWPGSEQRVLLEEVVRTAKADARGAVLRWLGSGAAAAAVIAAALLVVPAVLDFWNPAGSVRAVPAPTVVTPPASTPVESPDLQCVTLTRSEVSYALVAFEDGYERGWWAAGMAGNVLALERPLFDGREPVGVTIDTVQVFERGSAFDDDYGPVTDPAAEAAAIDCLEAVAEPFPPPRPDLETCRPADLAHLKIRPNQKLPLTVAYGSEIVDSAAFDTGDGFTVVAVRLAEPTGPDGADKVAWVMREGDGTGWVAPISPGWAGGGGPSNRVIAWGPLARDAAVKCLG